jgi:hypothetical protein
MVLLIRPEWVMITNQDTISGESESPQCLLMLLDSVPLRIRSGQQQRSLEPYMVRSCMCYWYQKHYFVITIIMTSMLFDLCNVNISTFWFDSYRFHRALSWSTCCGVHLKHGTSGTRGHGRRYQCLAPYEVSLFMFICCFTSRSRISHLYGDVIITGEGLQNVGLCSALRAFEQGGIFIVPHLRWHEASVFPVSSEGPPHLIASYDTQGEVENLF